MATVSARSVSGMVSIIRRCVGGDPTTHEIRINATAYLCRCEPGYYELVKTASADLDEPEVYHMPADLTSCDCADATYRCRECKHLKAVRALRTAGKL